MPAPIPLLDAASQFLLDEARDAITTSAGSWLVIDAPGVASALVSGQSPASPAAVVAFCDDAVDHAELAGIRVTPNDAVTAEVALLRLPTGLDQLDEYAAWAHASGVQNLAGVGHQKYLTLSMNDVLGRYFEDVRASRGRGKHRVLHASNPRPKPTVVDDARWPRQAHRDGLTIVGHGGTFGTTKLDAGTALLLGQLDQMIAHRTRRVLDVGSGNGTITAALARALTASGASSETEIEVVAVDRSWAGADATARTLAANELPGRAVWSDALTVLDDEGDFDLIVTNPPFHAGQAKESAFTRAMLPLAVERLAPGGQLWVVHNSHLPWGRLLADVHESARRVAQDRHFSVVRVVIG